MTKQNKNKTPNPLQVNKTNLQTEFSPRVPRSLVSDLLISHAGEKNEIQQNGCHVNGAHDTGRHRSAGGCFTHTLTWRICGN